MTEEPKLFVVLDSTAIVAAFFDVERAGLDVLAERSQAGAVTLVVPEVVVLEVVNKYRERLEQTSANIGSSFRRLGRLQEVAGVEATRMPGSVTDIDTLVDGYEQKLREWVRGADGMVPDLPTVGHRTLVERDLARRKPFSPSGTGYRDTLLWETVLELAVRGEVVLITDNRRDFAEGEEGWRLAADLRADVGRAGLAAEHIRVCPKPDDFLQMFLIAAPDVLATLTRRLRDDALLRERWNETLREVLDEAVTDSGSVPTVLVRGSIFAEGCYFTGVYDFAGLQLEVVRVITPTDVLVDIHAEADVDLDIYVHKSEAHHLPDSISVTEWDWNDYYAEASVSETVGFHFTVRCDPTRAVIRDAWLDYIEDIELE